jgi:hypothetical protein
MRFIGESLFFGSKSVYQRHIWDKCQFDTDARYGVMFHMVGKLKSAENCRFSDACRHPLQLACLATSASPQ